MGAESLDVSMAFSREYLSGIVDLKELVNIVDAIIKFLFGLRTAFYMLDSTGSVYKDLKKEKGVRIETVGIIATFCVSR